MSDEAAHSEPTEEEKSRKNILNVIYTVKLKEIKKKLQKHIIPKLSKLKLCHLCAEKLTAEEKLLKHRLCLHITFVIQLLFV